jgi:cytochrome c oxidase subunit 4
METTSQDPTHEFEGPEHSAHTEPPLQIYYKVYGALMVLLVLTVLVAQLPLGAFGVVLALLIAVSKAVLVLIYFMHLRYNSGLTWLFAAAGFVWLLLLFAFVVADYATRAWVGQ